MKLKYEQLTTHLKKELKRVYCISSDEILLKNEALDAIRQHAHADGFTERKSYHVDKSFKWQQLIDHALAYSLFSEKTILELHLPTAKPGNEGGKILQEYCQRLPEDKLLIIITDKLDSATQKTKWYKAIENAGVSLIIWPLSTQQLPAWVKQRAATLYINLPQNAIQFLINQNEGNLLALMQELEKLALLFPNATLTLEQIINCLADSARFDIFNLVDTILSGQKTKTLRILNRLQEEGQESILIHWAITREIRSLYNMAVSLRQNPIDAVLSQYRVWANRKPLIKKALTQFRETDFSQMLTRCYQLELLLKGIKPGLFWLELQNLALALSDPKWQMQGVA